ncbi:MAG: hypothetical protein LBT40_11770, partial [Deltaproteobacteria bacterium]|nr:hypothetical protein [Deltaproteobacteria bacterium]
LLPGRPLETDAASGRGGLSKRQPPPDGAASRNRSRPLTGQPLKTEVAGHDGGDLPGTEAAVP